jgi:hypothetical protein
MLIVLCAITFTVLLIYSAVRVRYDFGEKLNSEFTVTELSLSHSLSRASDGSLVLKPGNITNKGARRPCPT